LKDLVVISVSTSCLVGEKKVGRENETCKNERVEKESVSFAMFMRKIKEREEKNKRKRRERTLEHVEEQEERYDVGV